MTAPQIPNLLDRLRDTRASNARSGRGRGARSVRQDRPPTATVARPSSPSQQRSSTDAVIQQTDADAAGSRLSAIKAGYLSDAFADALAGSQAPSRRMPIINRGTYVRSRAIDALTRDFLDRHAGQDVQIVSLGAGTDTRAFRFLDDGGGIRCAWHEIDFAECTRRKVQSVTRAGHIRDVVERACRANTPTTVATAESKDEGSEEDPIIVSPDGTSLRSAAYSLHALDLRALTDPLAQLRGFSASKSTLLLSECCLTYLPSAAALAILQAFVGALAPSTPLRVILYEPLQPNDAFGRTMVANLWARGIALPGLTACPTLAAHGARLQDTGMGAWDACSVLDWWRGRVSAAEKERLRRVEMLDEEEEWELLAGHYGFVWGWREDG